MVSRRNAPSLDAVVRALHAAFVEVLVAPAGLEVPISSVTLVDPDDLSAEAYTTAAAADLYLLAGVREADAVTWLEELGTRSADLRPVAVMSKAAASSTLMQHAARVAGVALITVHSQTRWDRLLSMVRGVLDQSNQHIVPTGPSDLGGVLGADTDLFGLAHTVAVLTRGMVSIEDERSHVLAYSASNDQADELRTLSILGREGPSEYLRRLEQWGVYDSVRRSDDVVEVPAHPDLGIRRRLVAGIRTTSSEPKLLGTLWIQEGQRPLTDDAGSVLRGAAAVAARLITRIIEAPTNEALQIQRLLGARGGGVDVPSLAAALSIPTDGPAAVIGLAATGATSATATSDLSTAIRLHASSFHRLSLVTTIGDRIYVLIPRTRAETSVESWTRQLLDRIDARTTVRLRAAVASPVAALSEVAAARTEVDRVLDGTSESTGDRVTTLADSRTSVLLGEIVDMVAAHPALQDPRMSALVEYDARTSSSMCESTRVYLTHFGDVRRAAADLHVHPNTLRYRVRRVEEITRTDLSDPAARLLMEIQLAVWARQART
ncbi:PucR family transcriptional regulator [Rhodococcus sp. Leaf7]|uniref:PucR family transcriptional regulator n=1 Tax=unclassified Rhodococcus (in: high G+C Gram-positive bacteria) TaxID=192944 RepID=UPI0006FF00A5|nr:MULTISPECIES: helix-turn-helix domain-containing protein [unclassified Rhodococcus (in: high G+C Gram-positive bacteria)]KQU06929.1 PucR family transcriptional regulator [Rhodococcus sp. Leaf7]KQU42448.1 PucR family transcriptional regulator [Rhodococcus sp. Leaf247]